MAYVLSEEWLALAVHFGHQGDRDASHSHKDRPSSLKSILSTYLLLERSDEARLQAMDATCDFMENRR